MGIGINVGDMIFLSYLNDDDTKRNGNFIVFDKSDITLTIKTEKGIITIPLSRIIKIKRLNNEKEYS